MAIRESALPAVTVLSEQDYLRVVTSEGESRTVKISDLIDVVLSDAQNPTVTSVSDRNSKCTSGICSLTYDKVSKLVRIYFQASTDGTTNLGIDDAIFTIPQEYRPSAQKNGSCVCWNPTSTQMYVSTLQVRPTGELVQRSTSNCSRVFAYVEYKL